MLGDQFTIRRKSDKVLLYDEGNGRSIEFACRPNVDPPLIWVPTEPLWANKTPPWAHQHRAIIVTRLRASGAMVYEQSPELTTVLSPDGTFRVEMITQPDDRAAAWESTHVVTTNGDRQVLHLPLHGVCDVVQFPAPSVVLLPLESRFGQKHQLRFNVARNVFMLDSDPAEHPLSLLESKLRKASPQLEALYKMPKPRKRQLNSLGDIPTALICFMFFVGGIWMSFAATKTSDHLAGIFCVIFFGAGGVHSIVSFRRKYLARRNDPVMRRWSRFAPYIPLTFVGLEFLWLVLLFMGFIFMVGDQPYTSTPAKERLIDVVAALPAVMGLLLGLVGLLTGWARGTVDKVFLILGCLGCAMFVGGFGWGLIH